MIDLRLRLRGSSRYDELPDGAAPPSARRLAWKFSKCARRFIIPCLTIHHLQLTTSSKMSKPQEEETHLQVVVSIPGRTERRAVLVSKSCSFVELRRRLCAAWNVSNADERALLYRHSITGHIMLVTTPEEWADAVRSKSTYRQQDRPLLLELCECSAPTSAE